MIDILNTIKNMSPANRLKIIDVVVDSFDSRNIVSEYFKLSKTEIEEMELMEFNYLKNKKSYTLNQVLA